MCWCWIGVKYGGETVNHFFLHCPFAREVWSMILGLFGVSWVMLRSALDLLECWQVSFGRHRNFPSWRAVPHCLMWVLWRERNGHSFVLYGLKCFVSEVNF